MRALPRVLLACALLGPAFAAQAGDVDKKSCTYNGIPLRGAVKIVTAHCCAPSRAAGQR